MGRVHTPLRWDRWRSALAPHPDRDFADFLLDGIVSGFRIGFDYQRHTCREARGNMASVREDESLISAYLEEERRLGRVVGPLDYSSFPAIHCSPIGLIPKGSSGKWRLIVDLSSPQGYSVNDGISSDLCSLEYVTVDMIADVVLGFGAGAVVLSKVDIRSAYRLVPVHPEDRWLLGMRWGGQVFVDTVLPFGLRSAPKLFTALADAVEWIAKFHDL